MSMQQVLEVVRRHHVFWQNELGRASEEDLKDCEFFHRQCRDELAVLEAELDLPLAQRTRKPPSRKPADKGLSNARPATTRIGGRSKSTKVLPERRSPPRA